MSNRVRFALDIDVNKGDPMEVAAALAEERASIASFAGHVITALSEELSDVRITLIGGDSHVHPDDRDDLPCEACRKYSGRTALTRVDDE